MFLPHIFSCYSVEFIIRFQAIIQILAMHPYYQCPDTQNILANTSNHTNTLTTLGTHLANSFFSAVNVQM